MSFYILCLVLILSQLESGPSNLAKVKQPFSLFCVFWRIRLTRMEYDGFFCYTKGCPDGWSKHTPPKFKSG